MGGPLVGVKAYVDVRSSDGKANYSSCIKQQLEILGAEICSSLSDSCTHIVFKDGKISTRSHAKKLGALLVNVLWVEKCRETGSKCEELDYPVNDEYVETPIILKKSRTRYKSLQPSSQLPTSISKSRKKKLTKVQDSSTTEDVAPLKPSERLIRKLQWPPDHSDVCSEAELAEHVEISLEIKQSKRPGKRRLKKSEVFDVSVDNEPDNKSKHGPTENFILTKTPAVPKQSKTTVSDKEDSQISSYDASQHFERTDYSVKNMITKLDTAIEQDPPQGFDDLYSDSDSDYENKNPSKDKRKCDLSNSQKNIMDKTFEFDEIDKPKPSKPKKARSRQSSKSKSKPDDKKSTTSTKSSPDKMLLYSNFNDSDPAETREDIVLEHIESPRIVTKKTPSSTSRRNKPQDFDNTNSTFGLISISESDVSTLNNSSKPPVDQSKIVQEAQISSTSEPRRSSKRIRQSTSRVNNPDFVYNEKSSKPRKKPIETATSLSPTNVTEDQDRRRSGRQRKSNPRYSDNPPSKQHHDVSTSEYSTTETPGQSKPIRSRRRDNVLLNIATTTDTEETEGSGTEGKSQKGKRKKVKKSVSSASESNVKSRSRNSDASKMVLCTTCCHRDDQAMVRSTAKTFSTTVSEFVTTETTHVVIGTVKRTINLLKAILHGCYVLSLDWVTESISKNAWVKESKYQLISEFPILKIKGESRRRSAVDLFSDIGLIFVEKDTKPPQSDLTDLIQLCGGKITKSRTRCHYCIGGAAQDHYHISLSEQWVLDSITKLKLQDTRRYLLFPYRSPSPEF